MNYHWIGTSFATFGLSLFVLTPAAGSTVPGQTLSEKTLGSRQEPESLLELTDIVAVSADTPARRAEALSLVRNHWHLSYVPILLEILYLIDFEDRRARDAIWQLLEEKTGQGIPRNPFAWFRWLWRQDLDAHPDYAEFKGQFYSPLDDRFKWWFYGGVKHTIRLDEVLWGGVRVDGIPPLEYPSFVSAAEATYLEDDNVVFGAVINGEAKAYPKRILAWHELFNDRIGGVDVSCAYCTLCGAAILYSQKVGTRQFNFGTSGFLYRSNKLMYDRQTRSLWSSLEGVPVSGELAGSDLKLGQLPLVTTSWKVWKKKHPETLVLSLETGFERDYGEGVAYQSYFATDDLMFPVPQQDQRLKNKQEVLALRSGNDEVAFSTSFLKKNPLHRAELEGRPIVILTDKSGASRVYRMESARITKWDRESSARDSEGREWAVREEALVGSQGRLQRIPAHRAFWFGWYAQFPNSRLVR